MGLRLHSLMVFAACVTACQTEEPTPTGRRPAYRAVPAGPVLRPRFEVQGQPFGVRPSLVLPHDLVAAQWAKRAATSVPQLNRLATEIGRAPFGLDRAMLLFTWIYGSIGANSRERSGEADCGNDTLCIDELTLTLMDGACGYRAMLMIDVLASYGIKARRVGFFGIPTQIGHTAVEVQIGERWHFLDPSFGVYFADPASPQVPLSITEARRRYPDVLILRSRVAPWTGAWADVGGLSRESDEIAPGPIEHPFEPGRLIADVTQTYAVSTMHIEGTEGAYSQGIMIDADAAPSGTLGSVDERFDDLLGYAQLLSYGETYTPFLFVLGTYGRGIGPNVEDEFRFVTQAPRELRLTLSFTRDVSPLTRRHMLGRLRHVAIDYSVETHLIDFSWQMRSVAISIPLIPPMSTLRLTLGEGFGEDNNVYVDAISWSSVEDTSDTPIWER